MDEAKEQLIRPFEIFKESFSLWGANLIPVVAINSVTIFLWKIVEWSEPINSSFCTSWSNAFLSVVFLLENLAVFVLVSFVFLIVLNYLKEAQKGATAFASAFEGARAGIVRCLQTLFVLVVFVLSMAVLASIFFIIGRVFYSNQAPHHLRLAVLLAVDTAFVVIVLATAWYGFFFSLAPLVSALERETPVGAIRLSKSRMRGNALRCLFVGVLFLGFYIGAGLLACLFIERFVHSRRALNLVDPTLWLLFGPLALTIWLVTYQKLRELKK